MQKKKKNDLSKGQLFHYIIITVYNFYALGNVYLQDLKKKYVNQIQCDIYFPPFYKEIKLKKSFYSKLKRLQNM